VCLISPSNGTLWSSLFTVFKMPRFSGAGGLSQLRHENARDSLEEEGLARSTSWRLNNLAFGTLATSVAQTVAAPFRNIHLQLLLDRTAPFSSPAPAFSFSWLVGPAQSIYAREGVMGFFRGNTCACARVALQNLIKMTVWLNLRAILEDHTNRMSDYQKAAVAGVAAATVGVVATLPLQALEVRMMAGSRVVPHMQDEAQSIRERFWRLLDVLLSSGSDPSAMAQLYMGWKATLLGYVFQEVTLHIIHELVFRFESRPRMRRILVGMDERIKRVVRDSLVMFITRVHCLPLTNVVYQMQLTQEGFRECCLDIYHSAGVAGFYTGLVAQLWVVPYLCCYHFVMWNLYKNKEDLC